MRLRRSLAFSLPFIAQSAFQASAQSAAASQAAAPPPATRPLNTNGLSRFELQRMLAELDDRRRRVRASLDPADSVLRLFAADTLRLSAATRPLAVVADSVTVHQLFLRLRQTPASQDLRAQLIAAVQATANDFTSIEASLTNRIAKPQVARDYLERTPFAAVVPITQARPLENTLLAQSLRAEPGPLSGPLPVRLPRPELAEFETALSDSAFQSYKADLLSAFNDRMRDVQLLTKADREEAARLRDDAAGVSRAIGQREDDQARLDGRIVSIGIPAVALALIALFLAPLLYRSEDTRKSIVTSGLLVELMTVFLLTTAVIILGVDGRIQAEVIGTLLGGVSGYVLGRAINPPTRL
jgi:hypothetical protein